MIRNIDILRFKADMVYYSNIDDFVNDINALFRNIYIDLEGLINFDLIKGRKYLTFIYLEFIKMLPNDFNELYNSDVEEIINTNRLPRVSNFI